NSLEWNPLNARSRSAICMALALAGTLALAGRLDSQAPATSLTLLSKDARRTQALVVVNGQEYVGLDDLAMIFQFTIREDPTGPVTATYKGKTIVITADQAVAFVTGRLVALSTAPIRAGRRWLVPLDFISRAIGPIYDTRLDLRAASHLLVIGDLRV